MGKYSYVYIGISFFYLFFAGLIACKAEEEILQANQGKCEEKLTLDSFRAYALKNSPLVEEIDRDYANELAAAFKTETLQNPELHAEQSFTTMDLAGDNDAQIQISIGQPLRISNFGSRSEVAKLLRKSGDIEKRIKLMELIQKLTLQFETLAAYQQIGAILVDAQRRSAKKVLLIKEGVKKGLLSDGDEYLFEGEKYRLQAEAKGMTSLISVLRNEFSKSIGFPCLIQASYRTEIKDLPSDKTLVKLAKENQIGESARIDLLLDLTKEQVKLAELDAYPQITPRLIYQHTNDGGDYFGAGFTIPLPFWNQNQAAQYKVNAERKVAEKRASFVKNGGLESQIRTLRAAVVNSEEQAQLFREKIIPSFEKAFRTQERLYSEGKVNVLQVWQILRALKEVQTQGIQVSLEAKTLRIQLSTLIGEEI